ncbi:MAG TPA: hypothetical protein VFE40_00195 [Jatrophihabitantaceae bacterium]|nr:hypothetical protein [Jatrophihabitantaceae bacterium]
MSVRFSRSPLLYVALAAVLVVIGFGAYTIGSGGSSPADVVRSYLDALSRGDSDAALALGRAPADRTLLTDDVLRQQQSLAPITGIRVLSTRTGSDGAVVRVRYRIGGQQVTDAIELLPRGSGWMLSHVAVDVELSARSSLPKPTVFGVAVPSSGDLYVFPGRVQFGSADTAFGLAPATAVFSNPDVPAMANPTPVLSGTGRTTLTKLISAAMARCARSRSLHPHGCPQHTSRPTAHGLVAGSLRWHAPRGYGQLNSTDIAMGSDGSAVVHVSGPLTWRLTYSVRPAAGKRTVSRSRTVHAKVHATVDFGTTPPTLHLS